MNDLETRTIAKSIWALQQLIDEGKATARTRQMLLRAYARQVDEMEENLGIDPAERAFVLERDDSRDGVLFVHGSDGTPADLRALAEAVHAAGMNVHCMRLPGHAGSGENLQPGYWQSALYEVESRYKMLHDCCRWVAVVGHGLGATLAMQIEAKHRPNALVLLSPALFPKMGLWERILMSLGLDRFAWMRKRMRWPGDLLDAMGEARKCKWWYGLPVLVSQAKDDEVTDPRGLGFLRSRLSHHRTQIVEHATGGHRHHLEGQADATRQSVIEFLNANRGKR